MVKISDEYEKRQWWNNVAKNCLLVNSNISGFV